MSRGQTKIATRAVPDDFIKIFSVLYNTENAVPLLQLTATTNKQKLTINTCMGNIITDVEPRQNNNNATKLSLNFLCPFPRLRSEPALYNHSDSTLVCSWALVLCFDWLVKYRKFFG